MVMWCATGDLIGFRAMPPGYEHLESLRTGEGGSADTAKFEITVKVGPFAWPRLL